jgi:hypothetical protein
VALQLLRKGVLRVRPLKGGIETWRERGFPIVPMNSSAQGNK